MDQKLFEQIYGGALKNITTVEDLEKQRQEQEDEKDRAEKAAKKAKEQQKKDEESKKGILQKAGDFLAGAGKGIVSSTQQAAGTVADVAAEGGAVIGQVADDITGKSAKQEAERQKQNDADVNRIKEIGTQLKDKSLSADDKKKLRDELGTIANRPTQKTDLEQRVDNTEKIRDTLHNMKDVSGNKIVGTTDVDDAAGRIASGQGSLRDVASVAGKGLETGLDATMFANPARIGVDAAKVGGEQVAKIGAKQAAKFAARDAAFFGTGQGLATGAETYGQTGDLGKSLEAGGKSALMSAATQGTLDLGGALVGKAVGNTRKNLADSKKTQEIASNIANDTKTNGGATVGADGAPASEGFSYSPYKDAETVIDADKFSEKDVQNFIKQHKDKLSDPDNKVGTWTDNGKVYLDISRVSKDRNSAIKDAADNKQLAIYDLGKGEEIKVGDIDDKGNYTPDEKTLAEANAQPAPQSTTQFADISDDELAKQVDNFKNGERTDDPAKDYARYQELKDEVDFRNQQQERGDFQNNGLPNDVEGAQKALDDLDAGNIPEHAKKPMKADIKDVSQIFANEHIPQEIRSAAQEVMDDRGQAERVLDTLMNDKKYNKAHLDMDRAYKQRQAEINEMPGPRAIQEQQKLDAQYQDDLAELEMVREKDKPDVEHYQQIVDTLDQRERQIVGDTNYLIESAPDKFMVPDETEVAAHREALVNNLEQAKKFGEETPTLNRIAESGNPDKELARSPEAREEAVNFTENEMNEMKGTIKNAPSVSLALQRVISPSQLLQKAGLRQVGRDLHTGIVRAIAKTSKANKADAKALKEIKKVMPTDKASLNQIVDYLEGNRKTLDLGNEKAADMIRSFLDEKKTMLQEAGYDTIKDFYFPHIKENNPELFTRLFGENKATGDVSFGNLKHRDANSNDYSKDILQVLSTYSGGLNRKLNLEPALKPLEEVSTQLKLASAESEKFGQFAQFIDGYLNQVKGTEKSKVGQAANSMIDAGLKKIGLNDYVGRDHYSQSLGLQRMVSATATMGLSVSTAVRNMTQVVNTVADIGPKWASIGSVDGTRMLLTKEGRAELQRAGIFDGGVSKEAFNDVVREPGVAGRFSKTSSTAADGLMSLMHGTDVVLRAQAYAGAKAKAISKGLKGVEAENYAIRKVIDTQFMTSKVDAPLAFNGQGMRSLTQLATFSGKQAGFLKRMGVKVAKGEDGKGFKLADAGSVLTAVASAALMTEALKPVIGMDEKEWVPFYDQIAPVVAGITGQEADTGTALYRSPLVRLLFGDGKSKDGLFQAIANGGDMEGFIKDNWSQLLPGGTQLNKTIQGIQSVTSGESKNDSGKTRFLQDQGDLTPLQAAVFGQYSTKAGQDWIKNGFPTLSDSQTEKVDEATTRKEKEQLADFFAASKNIDYSGGRNAAYAQVKYAVMQGNTNKAKRLADEYNSAVDDAMSNWYSKYGDDMPKDLKDTLNNKMYITVNKVEDRYGD